MNHFTIRGNLVDCLSRSLSPASIEVREGRIQVIEMLEGISSDPSLPFIIPGFIDAHVHIESSMLIPAAFARLAVVHGTVATVSDPHEIANVCGIEGVRFMIENGKTVPFKFNFGAPSCVPATVFETAGDVLDASHVKALLESEDVKYLTEMMNFPGAIAGDPEILEKIASAQALGKPVDGHAPGLSGDGLRTYVARGISTDHECFTIEEAKEKLTLGMKIIIREGSAAKNFDALIPLIESHPEMIMFCSDDKHPDSLVEGHINQLCARAVKEGYDVFNILQAACINPVEHYKLNVGLLKLGDPADFILLNNLSDFKVLATYIDGVKVAENGLSLIPDLSLDAVETKDNKPSSAPINRFGIEKIDVEDLKLLGEGEYGYPVIECIDGQLMTNKISLQPLLRNGAWCSNTANDVLKIVVVNRYHQAPIAKAFIHRFGLTAGAIASSVAHDSHNIVAIGVDDESLAKAINLVIETKGGVSCVGPDTEHCLPLPIGGLMSAEDGYAVAAAYTSIDKAAKSLGSTLSAPFMSLSFMALLVIPHIKLSDKGLFDGDGFGFYE
ncbi:MAG: adenine deaminase [bacterium]|jgi:adenine deaminase|nr:adenine deaminase [Chitinophagaceae bacterium]